MDLVKRVLYWLKKHKSYVLWVTAGILVIIPIIIMIIVGDYSLIKILVDKLI